jgi:hypothetical protein
MTTAILHSIAVLLLALWIAMVHRLVTLLMRRVDVLQEHARTINRILGEVRHEDELEELSKKREGP